MEGTGTIISAGNNVLLQVAGPGGQPMYLTIPQGLVTPEAASTDAQAHNDPSLLDQVTSPSKEESTAQLENNFVGKVTEEQIYGTSLAPLQESHLTSEPKVFSRVTASLSMDIIQKISTDIMKYLEDVANMFGVTININTTETLLEGNIEQLIKAEEYFSALLDGYPTPNRGKTVSHKAVSCNIIQPLFSRSGRAIKNRFAHDFMEVESDDDNGKASTPKTRYLNKRRGRPPKIKIEDFSEETNNLSNSGISGSDPSQQDPSNDFGSQMLSENSSSLESKLENIAAASENSESIIQVQVGEIPACVVKGVDDVQKLLPQVPSDDEKSEDDQTRIEKGPSPLSFWQKRRQIYEERLPFKFFCDQCSFKTKRKSHFETHLEYHKKHDVLQCKNCEFRTLSVAHLRRHQVLHSGHTFSCGKCSFHTLRRKDLKKHIMKKHVKKPVKKKDDFENGNEVTEKKELYKCPHCPYKTARNTFYTRHLACHIQMSFEVQQNEIVITQESVDEYKCRQCTYTTKVKDRFMRHMTSVHVNTRPFLCDICGYAFKRKDALKQHKVVHMDKAARVLQHVCPECHKGFRSNAHLKEHMTLHTGERPFLCEHCGSSFKARSSQQKHIKTIHKNPRSFECSQCQCKFNTKYALSRHVKTHLIKPAEEVEDPTPEVPLDAVDTDKVQVVHLPTHDVSLVDLVKSDDLTNPSEAQEAATAPAAIAGAFVDSSGMVHQVTPQNAYIATSEASTALLYLTSNFQGLQ